MSLSLLRSRRRLVAAGALVGLAVLSIAALAPGVGGVQSISTRVYDACPDGRVAIRQLPYLIDQPGSYFAASCLTGVSGQDGIIVDADDVTIDLNGFTLSGVPGSLSGIKVVASHRNVRIHDGCLRDWGGAGADLFGSTDAQLRSVLAAGNGGMGLGAGMSSIVRGCAADGNDGSGITVGFGSTVVECTAAGNQQCGIEAAIAATTTGCTLRSCTVRGNAAFGILAGDGCTLTGCTANFGSSGGISVGNGCVISACTAMLNAGDGITAYDSLVRGNASVGNGGLAYSAPFSTMVENH